MPFFRAASTLLALVLALPLGGVAQGREIELETLASFSAAPGARSYTARVRTPGGFHIAGRTRTQAQPTATARACIAMVRFDDGTEAGGWGLDVGRPWQNYRASDSFATGSVGGATIVAHGSRDRPSVPSEPFECQFGIDAPSGRDSYEAEIILFSVAPEGILWSEAEFLGESVVELIGAGSGAGALMIPETEFERAGEASGGASAYPAPLLGTWVEGMAILSGTRDAAFDRRPAAMAISTAYRAFPPGIVGVPSSVWAVRGPGDAGKSLDAWPMYVGAMPGRYEFEFHAITAEAGGYSYAPPVGAIAGAGAEPYWFLAIADAALVP